MTTTVVCHDAGGAELISNYVINKKNINFVIRGPAKKIFQDNIKNFKNISFIKAIKKSKIVICGTGAFSNLEKKTIKKCKEKNIKVVSWIDNWTNYEKRFLLDGKLILPDEIWVSDIRAYKKTKKIFPNIVVIKKKNFYFDNLKKKIRKKTHKKKEKILYICGLLNGKNPINKLEIDSINNFLSHLKKNIRNFKIILRYHPSEKKFLKKKIINKYNIKISSNKLIDDLNWSDIIVGASTMAFILSKKLKLNCFSSIPENYSMNKNKDFDQLKKIFIVKKIKKLFYDN